MALSIRSEHVEELARELSRRTGKTMTDAIGEALGVRLRELGLDSDRIRSELFSAAQECMALPDLDTRTADEILGYDANGGFEHGR